MVRLYHGTSERALNKIRQEGLRPVDEALGVYLTDLPLLAQSFCHAHGHRDCPVMCEVDVSDLDKTRLEVDWIMMEDPTKVVSNLAGCFDEEDGFDAECWANHTADGPFMDREWEKSLEVAHSVVYTGSISPNKVRCRKLEEP